MKRILIIYIVFAFTVLNMSAQERGKSEIKISNTNDDLTRNNVASITITQYKYKVRKKKLQYELGNKIETQLFDSLGRNTEVVYFNDSTGDIKARYKYYYADLIGRLINKIEHYNENDSLITVKNVEEENGQVIYMVKDEGVKCFGNYKFNYNKNGLIDHAIWYGPKNGIWASENMKPYYIYKLSYTFR